MKKTILKTTKLLLAVGMLSLNSFKSQAQTFTYGNNTNAVATSGATTSGATTNYTFTIPFYEPNMTGTFNIGYNTTFTCGPGYFKSITLHKTDGTYVSNSTNSNGVSIPGSSMPVGTTSYVMKVYCASGGGLPSQLLATRYINITVVKEADPSLNLTITPYCKLKPHVTPPQYSGYIGFNVTGSYTNASKLYLNVTNTAVSCAQADTKLTALSNNINLPNNTITNPSGFYDCNTNTTYTVSMIYRSTTITGQNLVYDIPNGSYGWNDLVWQKKFTTCLNKLEPQPEDPLELKTATVVYPNPAKEVVNVKLADEEKIIAVSVLDFSSGIQKKQEFKNGTSEQNIDIANLKKGIYILEIVTDKGVRKEKFVKE